MAVKRPPKPTPSWSPANAERHRWKHTKCFAGLSGIVGREISVSEFKARSQFAIDGSWAEFEATKLQNERAAYFVDDNLVQAITTLDRGVFKTCFHQHFDSPRRCEELMALSYGAVRLMFRDYLDRGEHGGVFTGVKRIRGV